MMRYVRNKVLVLSLAGGLTAVGVGSILGEVPGQIAGIKSPSDLMALLSGRSPGDRAAGALANKTKRPLVEHKMAERDTPAAAMAVPPAALAVAPLLAPPAAAAAIVPAAAAVVPAAAASSGFFLPPFLVPLGGGGGGVTVTEVVPPPGGGGGEPPPPPPGPAVPEPDTWLMLTIGFGALGGILRRRRRLSANEGRAHGNLAQLPATA